MSKYCEQVATITKMLGRNVFEISLDNGCNEWSDTMFEGLVEEEEVIKSIESVQEWKA